MTGQKRSFGDLAELALDHKAVALGILTEDGDLTLRSACPLSCCRPAKFYVIVCLFDLFLDSPARKEVFKLNAGDSVVVFADTL